MALTKREYVSEETIITAENLNEIQDEVIRIGNALDSGDLKGEPGADGITPHVGSNGNWFIGDNDTGIPATGPAGGQGLPGTPGEDGKDGVSATHSWNGTVLTITSASGTSSANLKGETGEPGYTPQKGIDYHDGQNGKDGTSVTVSSVSESSADGGSNVVTFSDGKTLTVKNGKTGATGGKGEDGKTPVKGVDYWTEADKEEIVDLVVVSLGGQPVFGRVDSNNNIIITAALEDGVYTLKYEYEDGTTADIGTVTVGGEDEPTVIDITWNNYYKCSYTVGQNYALVSDSSYCTSDVIEVEAGTKYTLTINNNETVTKFRVVGANSNGIVTEIMIDNVDIAVGNNTYTFTPSSGTTQIRLRTYVDAHVKATWVLTKE